MPKNAINDALVELIKRDGNYFVNDYECDTDKLFNLASEVNKIIHGVPLTAPKDDLKKWNEVAFLFKEALEITSKEDITMVDNYQTTANAYLHKMTQALNGGRGTNMWAQVPVEWNEWDKCQPATTEAYKKCVSMADQLWSSRVKVMQPPKNIGQSLAYDLLLNMVAEYDRARASGSSSLFKPADGHKVEKSELVENKRTSRYSL